MQALDKHADATVLTVSRKAAMKGTQWSLPVSFHKPHF